MYTVEGFECIVVVVGAVCNPKCVNGPCVNGKCQCDARWTGRTCDSGKLFKYQYIGW